MIMPYSKIRKVVNIVRLLVPDLLTLVIKYFSLYVFISGKKKKTIYLGRLKLTKAFREKGIYT